MIDPLSRWEKFGEKPDFAGLLTFAGLAYTEDPRELSKSDVAIVGAPMDELVSDRPGARLGPRAIRAASSPPGPHLETGSDPFASLRMIDFGDAPVVPGDPRRSHRAIQEITASVFDAGVIPIVLGGDHSITEPILRSCNERWGRVGLIHFDAHTDTAEEVFGTSLSHGTPMRNAVVDGLIDPARYVQIGLRGYWPPPEIFEWQRDHGITSYLAADVRKRGMDEIVSEVISAVGEGAVYITVDVDVLDPAFAPGTGTPEPGGLTSAELLGAVRTLATELKVVGADVVEVAPTAIGTADITALVADRIVRELLAGIGASAHGPKPATQRLNAAP